jgi:hypothetical protein
MSTGISTSPADTLSASSADPHEKSKPTKAASKKYYLDIIQNSSIYSQLSTCVSV